MNWLLNSWGGGVISGFLLFSTLFLLASSIGRIMDKVGRNDGRIKLDSRAAKKIRRGVDVG